jgi:N-acetyl-gamma-glutamyl-phosphate reductase
MIKVGIIGAAGYGGGELVRLICQHPEAELVSLTGHSNAGKHILDVFPHLRGYTDLMITELDVDYLAAKADVVFLALPHGHAVATATTLIEAGVKVIDLGADFRFNDTKIYEEWYKVEHTNPNLAGEAVYALPEIWRESIPSARVIGNPGCYPTSIALGLYPLLKAGLAELDSIIIDSKSGVSGAGRTPSSTVVYSECDDSINPYKVASHRHTPEIEQSLSRIAGGDIKVTFTPHLTPMTRGILSTIYAKLNVKGLAADIQKLYEDTYKGEFFVRVLPQGVYPKTKWVAGSNFCDISVKLDTRTGRIVICSVIDNLVKGAAGQAVQNMNILFGLPENTGLKQVPMFP